MNPRERRLLVVLLTVLSLGAGIFVVYQWFWKPYRDYRTAQNKLLLEIERKEDEEFNILKDKALLEKYRAWSLPPGPDRATAEYSSFLQALVSQARLTDVNFQSPTVTEPRPASPGQAGKKPGHTVLTFTLRAKGGMENVVKALEGLRKAPVAHRVKSLTLDRADVTSPSPDPRLNVRLVIEALIVRGAEAKPDAPPVAQRAPLKDLGDRNYADIARKNVFAGAPLPSPPDVDPDAGLEIAQFVKLDTTDVDGKQAFLRNYLHKSGPMRLRSVPRSGYDTFRVTNEDRSKTLLRAKVLRIDQRDVYFQVGEDVYGVHIGQSIADAMRRPLSIQTMDDLELTALYDEEWAAEEMEANRGKGAKTGRKAPQKKGGDRRGPVRQ